LRFRRFLFSSALAITTTAAAQTIPNVLTEDDAVRISQASQSVVALSAAQLDLARSDVERERRWPNPTLDYTRESAGETEQFLTLSQSFDFSGRRLLRRRAAELRVEATQQEVAGQQLDLARIVRSEFSRAASQQELVRALTEWSNKIGAAAERRRVCRPAAKSRATTAGGSNGNGSARKRDSRRNAAHSSQHNDGSHPSSALRTSTASRCSGRRRRRFPPIPT
jgi:hypothetical protein